MIGNGEILAVYFGQQPHFDLVDRLNLTNEQMKIIRVIDISSFNYFFYFEIHRYVHIFNITFSLFPVSKLLQPHNMSQTMDL